MSQRNILSLELNAHKTKHRICVIIKLCRSEMKEKKKSQAIATRIHTNSLIYLKCEIESFKLQTRETGHRSSSGREKKREGSWRRERQSERSN